MRQVDAAHPGTLVEPAKNARDLARVRVAGPVVVGQDDHVNFEPLGMSAEALQRGLVSLARRLYDPCAVAERRERFFEQVRAGSGVLSPALEEEAAG